jgi:glycosyltransferase involved in cell wall biosynthesis
MQIAHLSTNDFGGAAIAAMNLHRALLHAGVESDLLTLGRTRHDIPRHHLVDPHALHPPAWLSRGRYKARRLLERAGLADDRSPDSWNKHLRGRPPGRESFSLPWTFFDVLRHPIVQRADIINLHWVSRGMIDNVRFFEGCGKPVVWTLHDMNPFTGGCHHADECKGYEAACRSCPQLADPDRPHRWWQAKHDAIARFPDERLALVAPSQWLANRCEASSIMAGRACDVVPNGFDASIFKLQDRAAARAALGWPADRRIVLFSAFDAGNPRKGLDMLIPAMSGPGEDALLVSMGAPMPALQGRPDALSTGLLSDPSLIARQYAAADIFVLPSMAENLPNTICEAHLCGTPAVAFAVGGIPEQIDGSNGLLVHERSAEELRKAIRAALSSNWDHAAIAASAHGRYNAASVASRYQAIYRRLPR